MAKQKHCIVCLATDEKMFTKTDYSLGQIYFELTTIPLSNCTQHFCFVCASLLRKYHKFKSKCVRANDILNTVTLTEVTKNLLKTLQTQYDLGTNLTFSEVTTKDTGIKTNKHLNTTETCKKKTANSEFNDSNDFGVFVYQHDDILSACDDFGHDMSLEVENPKQKIEIEIEITSDILSDVKHEPNSNGFFDKNDNDEEELFSGKNENVKCEKDNDESSQSNCTNTCTERIKKTNKLNLKKMGSSKRLPIKRQNISTNNKNRNVIKDKRRIVKKTKQIKNSNSVLRSKQDKIQITKGNKLNLFRNKYMKKFLEDNNIENISKHGTLEVLTQDQAKNEVLMRANSDNYINLPYKCNLCFRGFEREETLENHMFRHNPQHGEYECDNCHCRFANKTMLTRHLYCNHRVKFTCGVCSCVFDTVYGVTKHLDYHNGKTFNCKYCDQKFKIRNTLSMHIHTKHQNEFDTQYICEFCGGAFVSERGFNYHKRIIHINEKNEYQGPECKQCSVHFSSQQAWERHLVVSRNHKVPNGCKRCGERFESSFELRKHMKIHARPKTRHKQETRSYICQFCGKELRAEFYYKRHLHKMHGQDKPTTKPQPAKSLICEICGDKFVSRSTLETHTWKHTGELPHKCQYCGKGFRLKMSLKVHENLHTRAKIYKCDVCEKEFLRQDSFDRHVRQHKGNIHQCMACDRSFNNMWNLKSHIKRKHEHT